MRPSHAYRGVMEGPGDLGTEIQRAQPTIAARATKSAAATIARAHEALLDTPNLLPAGVRAIVRDSWQRCTAGGVDPGLPAAPAALQGSMLIDARTSHPLSGCKELIDSLLTDVARQTGAVVAVGDALGRLLWVEGDKALSRKAESMGFAPGADWSELAAGTNAPGTALALDAPVQIFATEHFMGAVQPWSCTAMPVHDPHSGAVLGVVDLTGDEQAAGPQALGLVRATVAAVEATLRAQPAVLAPAADTPWRLEVMGRDCAEFQAGARRWRLSLRHSELMLLLAMHPEGLSADALAVLLHDVDVPAVTVRAELARLRRIVGPQVLLSRPYRLAEPVVVDAMETREALDRGEVRGVVGGLRGLPIPRSESPAVSDLREQMRWHVRRAAMASRDAEVLVAYTRSPQGREDVEALRTLLTILRPDSPLRPGISAQLRVTEIQVG